ncbi:MAG: hypothetical protein V4628_11715 [Pseudomonadota bacterium]
MSNVLDFRGVGAQNRWIEYTIKFSHKNGKVLIEPIGIENTEQNRRIMSEIFVKAAESLKGGGLT